MNLALMIKFWREILMILLIFSLLFSLVLIDYKNNQLKSAQTKCVQQIQTIEQKHKDILQKQQIQIDKVSNDYENFKIKQRISNEKAEKQVAKTVEKPIYLDTCIDDDGRLQLNDIINSGKSKHSK